jgi:HAD superfamily hydrolase (TIGR01549 family)
MAELVILDIGNTLVTGPPQGPAQRIAAALGLSAGVRRELQRALMTMPFRTPAEVAAHARERLGVAHPGLDAVVADVWRRQEHEARPTARAAELLRGGARLALLSNIWRPYLTSVRRHFGAIFDARIPRELQLFSFELGDAKPSRALFELVLDRAGVAPADAMMVGDSYASDIAPAAALGLQTVWVGA